MVHHTPALLLRRAARNALSEFGLTKCRLTQIASRHNDVFRVDVAPQKRLVLRIQNDLLSDAQAKFQIEWMEALAKESGVVVPAPIRTLDRRPFTHVEMNGRHRRAVLLRWLPGRTARTGNEASYRAAARMIAQLHKHAETFRPRRGFACRTLDGDWLFGSRFFVRAANANKYLDASQRKQGAAAERLVRGAMENLGRSRRRFGVIHADLNLGNIIFNRGRASPIDFDEFGKCWYLFDLAELIRTSITPDNWAQRKELAISAYTDERKLDDAELQAFDAFIVATFVQYLNWAFLHARDDKDLRWVGFCLDVIGALCSDRSQATRPHEHGRPARLSSGRSNAC